MNSKFYPERPAFDERIVLVIPAADKRKAFEAAAREGLSVSQFVRRALAKATNQQAA